MIIGTCKLRFTAEWVTSLKEKRMVVKSIVEKAKHKFNISAAEIDLQDIHQTIAVGFACVTNDAVLAEQIVNNVIDYMDYNTDAVLENTEIEILRV